MYSDNVSSAARARSGSGAAALDYRLALSLGTNTASFFGRLAFHYLFA